MGKRLLGLAHLFRVSWVHCSPLVFPAHPAFFFFLTPFSCIFLVCNSVIGLKYHCDDTSQVLFLLWKWEADTMFSKIGNLGNLFPDKTSPVPSPPWPLALIPVSLAQTFTLACPAALWYHRDIISPCPQVKSPKPTSTIFPNSVNGDPVLRLPHVSDTTVLLFSYSLLPSHRQVLQTPPSKCVWSVTLSLHSCCSHFGPDHHHLSPGLFQLPPQL